MAEEMNGRRNEWQKKCWQNHKPSCKNIGKLESQRKEKNFANMNFLSESNLTPKEEIKLVKLVCQKCIVDCYLWAESTFRRFKIF